MISTALRKRLADGNNYGVCILAEEILSKMISTALRKLFGDREPPTDQCDHILLDNAELVRTVVFSIFWGDLVDSWKW
jgi:hypothetical protein